MKKTSYILFLCIVLITIAIHFKSSSTKELPCDNENSSYTLNDVKALFPEAAFFSKNSDKSISIKDDNGTKIGLLLCSKDLGINYNGYNGPLPLIIGIDRNQKVNGIILLPNQETRSYLQYIKSRNLLNRWTNQSLDTSLVFINVDAVSGATYSSSAIINTVKGTVSEYLKIKQNQQIRWLSIVRIALTLLLIALALNMLFTKRLKKFYYYFLLIVIAVFGIWFKQMLSIGLLHTWLTKEIPLKSNIELICILLLSVIMSLLGHRKFYCNYLCPMGAVQVLVAKISPFKKRNLNLKFSRLTLRGIYLIFIGMALLLGFTLPLYDMEPFSAFSFSIASIPMLCAGGAIVVLSLFFNRPWCQLCPTGCLLDSVPTITKKKK